MRNRISKYFFEAPCPLNEGEDIVGSIGNNGKKRNIKAGTTKGTVTADDALISATTGHATSKGARLYASDNVVGEIVGAGDGGTSVYNSHTCARKPVIGGSIVVTYTIGAVTYTATDASTADGTLAGTNLTSGSVVLATGVVNLTFAGNVDNSTNITIDYRYNVEKDTDGIGELNLEVTSSNVDAQVFPLKLQYTVFSAINLQKIHGLVLADEGINYKLCLN